MAIVLHLVPLAEVRALGSSDPITSTSLAADGFIHCTDTHDVLLGVANAFYTGLQGDVVALHIDVDELSSPCIWESPAHLSDTHEPLAALFPHVYGPIDRKAVVAMQHMTRDADGGYVGFGEVEDPPRT